MEPLAKGCTVEENCNLDQLFLIAHLNVRKNLEKIWNSEKGLQGLEKVQGFLCHLPL
jgi:hypothetical protein